MINRLQWMLGLALTFGLAFSGCESSDSDSDGAGGEAGMAGEGGEAGMAGEGGEAGMAGEGGAAGMAGEGGEAGSPGDSFDTPADIEGYIDGKLLVMEGDDIPPDPNGFNENVDLGPNTQCYHRVEMTFSGGIFSLNTTLGTLADDACDRAAPAGGPLMFSTTAHVLNGTGECFDIDLTFAGFGQEGRGSLTEQYLALELFFSGQAANHRCADGDVGSEGVVLNGMPFAGDAVQLFAVPQE